MSSAVTVDTSELDALGALLDAAATAAPVAAYKTLGEVVEKVHAEAVTNAARRRDTGELMESVDYDTAGMSRRVYADPRQGWFLEYGSPTTGAPDPWMTGPAERGSRRLLESMADVGRIW